MKPSLNQQESTCSLAATINSWEKKTHLQEVVKFVTKYYNVNVSHNYQ